MYHVQLSKAVQRSIKRLAPAVRQRVRSTIDTLAQQPRPPGVQKMAGSDRWRVRVGNYRIVYHIEDDRLIVTVVRVGHRREVYR